jgi:hypothetical protein
MSIRQSNVELYKVEGAEFADQMGGWNEIIFNYAVRRSRAFG